MVQAESRLDAVEKLLKTLQAQLEAQQEQRERHMTAEQQSKIQSLGYSKAAAESVSASKKD